MLIITGTIAFDYIMDFPGLFSDHILKDKIHNINLSFIVNKFAKRRGGTAGNVSYTLGLLKTPNILFSTAGKDFTEYAKVFKKMGINLDHVLVDRKKYTATGFAMTDKKNNQIWGYFYGIADEIENLKLKNLSAKDDLILIGPSGAKGSLSLLKQAVNLKIDYMFDPGFILTQITNNELTLGIKWAKYIIGNDYEINLIKTRVEKWSEIIENKIVITTLGERGARIEFENKIIEIAASLPKKIVDPTGAGDAWRAGFLAGIERGYDLKISGQMGSIAAAFAIENYGTQEHHFTINQFEKRYRKSFKSMLKL